MSDDWKYNNAITTQVKDCMHSSSPFIYDAKLAIQVQQKIQHSITLHCLQSITDNAKTNSEQRMLVAIHMFMVQ